MHETESRLIHRLEKIREEVKAANPNDQDAWKIIFSELDKVILDIPEQMANLIRLPNLCLEATQAICYKKIEDSLTLLKALSETVKASQDYLRRNSEDDSPILVTV